MLILVAQALAAPCDPAAVAAVAEAARRLASVDALDSVVAATGVSLACPRAGFSRGAAQLALSEPSEHARLDLLLANEDFAAWSRACPAAPTLWLDLGPVSAAERRGVLWDRCNLAATGWWTDRDDWVSRRSDLLVLPLLAGHALAESQVPAPDIAGIVRALSGPLPGRTPTALGPRGSGIGGTAATGSLGDKSGGKLVQGEPIVVGGLERKLVDEVVRRHANAIRYCYQREAVADPSLRGTLEIEFQIGPDGTVFGAAVRSSTLGSASIGDCVVGRFVRMQFPAPSSLVQVRQPLSFTQ